MGRRPCCSKEGLNRGAWTAMEDKILTTYIEAHGEGKWRNLPKRAGLKRCGKSCRLRWLNYLRPDIKRGNITDDEEELIIRLHRLLGNRWSLIAGRLPGRTDNEIKNYWNTTLRKKEKVQSPSSSPPPPPSKKSKSQKKLPAKTSIVDHPSPAEPTFSQVIRTKATRCTRVIFPTLSPLSVDAPNSDSSELQHIQPCFFTDSGDSNGGPEKETENQVSTGGPDEGYDPMNEYYVDPQQCLTSEEPIFKDWLLNYTDENSSFDLDSFAYLFDPQPWP